MTSDGLGETFDLIVVGGGVIGLSCALAAARRGRSVLVVDRDAQANGASIRNFGFVTVSGQARGEMWSRARRACAIWREAALAARIPILQRGLLVAARRPEAAAVAEAFLATEMGEGCRLLSRSELAREHPHLAAERLEAVLFSPWEVRVESREALPLLAEWLAREHGVSFLWGVAVHEAHTGAVTTSRGVLRAENIVVCPGDDLATLFPEAYAAAGVTRCKLQMLRLADPGRRFGACVMSDLGLARYAGYAALPEARALQARLAGDSAAALAAGVHLIVVQSADGSLVVGDSHHYAPTPHPFSDEGVDALILAEYAAVFADGPPPVVSRWTGTYAYAPDRTTLVAAPEPGVRLVVVTTGAGASVGFALGEDVIAELFEEAPLR